MEGGQTQGTPVGDRLITRRLGEGTTGKVKLALHRLTGEQVAIKIIAKSSFEGHPEVQLKVQREIALMRLITHPNILKLLDVLESRRHLDIILEYAEKGELFDYRVSRESLPVDVAMEIFRQIVLAVEHLHRLGICHRDLKPENILLSSSMQVKIADCGFARSVPSNLTETSCGSPHYAAPEIVLGAVYDGRIADIWSTGAVLYALLAGYLPFDDPSIRNLLNRVKRGVYAMPDFPAPIQDLIRRMLTVDVARRIRIDEIKRHPAFVAGLDPAYVLPAPLQHAQFGDPIDVASLPEFVVENLAQIGFPDPDDLAAQLDTAETTMAKVFVAMLLHDVDLQRLPWEASHSGPPTPLAQTAMEIGPITINPAIETRRFGRREHIEIGSPGGTYSMPDTRWRLETMAAEEVTNEIAVDTFDTPIWSVMAKIQVVIGDMPFQWLHPNLALMYVRSQDAELYFTVSGIFRSQIDVSVIFALNKGAADRFHDVVERIQAVLLT
jgi:BR serine/threonine kinase